MNQVLYLVIWFSWQRLVLGEADKLIDCFQPIADTWRHRLQRISVYFSFIKLVYFIWGKSRHFIFVALCWHTVILIVKGNTNSRCVMFSCLLEAADQETCRQGLNRNSVELGVDPSQREKILLTRRFPCRNIWNARTFQLELRLENEQVTVLEKVKLIHLLKWIGSPADLVSVLHQRDMTRHSRTCRPYNTIRDKPEGPTVINHEIACKYIYSLLNTAAGRMQPLIFTSLLIISLQG